MVRRLCALLWAPLWALAAASGAPPGPVVRCEPCDSRARAQCQAPTAPCAELVPEPGCGCCQTCALPEGRPCGVYTELCGAGLRCRPRRGEQKPLHALLDGKGLCTNVSGAPQEPAPGAGGGEVRALLLRGTRGPGNASNSEEDQNISSTENQSVSNTQRLLEPKSHAHHTKIDVIRKEHAKNTQRYKYDSQSTDTLNFSSESKQETEYGPCRREMEDTLNNLKILNVLSPRGLHIPNCDKKGFYKKKQCRPSRGRKRGYCWCVDKYGQRLPGYDGKGKGDVHCYNLESK
ncbi:insulin-like growth factor-binding protein 3 isoform X1 [Podarcis raffonei]|uniref:insulin-like growth factor-binding protein 3 isoform X1 n=1 Tax=Podarcis raffonei TaxID=65483 RepID=UPI00232974BB|nr:insulin-like growth factor-binding protein 3 isoform X1 [Podarcis raffonei]